MRRVLFDPLAISLGWMIAAFERGAALCDGCGRKAKEAEAHVSPRPGLRRLNAAALAISVLAWFGAPSAASAAPKVIFLTSGTSWTVPSDWNSVNNTIECVGAGGTGGIITAGSGGAYAERSNVSLTPGGSVSYAVGTATTALNAHGGDTWFSSTSILECAGGDSGGASHGDVTFAGGAGGTGTSTHNGAGGGGAGGPLGAGSAGQSISGAPMFAGNGGAGDNGVAAGGAGGENHESFGGSAQGGPGSSEALWTQTIGGAVAGPGGGGGGSGSNLPNAAKAGGAGGAYGGGTGGAGRGSPDKTTNTAGQPGIIVITYTPSGGSGVTANYAYDVFGRLTCVSTSDGNYTSYSLDRADNRQQVTTNTSACGSTGQAPNTADSMATVSENSSGNNIQLSISGGTPTSVLVTTSASHGTAMASGITISYTPSANYVGGDSFQYTASNGYGTSSPPSTVTITVSATVQPPVANPVSKTVAYNSSGNNVPLNITGGPPTSVTVSTAANHGTATVTGASSISYTPTSGYSGSDSFYYTATNAGGTSSPAKASITVNPRAPVANPSSITVAYNSTGNNVPLSISGGTPTSVTVSTGASHGTATASGTLISYSPTAGYTGSDSFQYTASNAGGTSSPATVSITVSQQPPIANPVSDTVGENSMYNTIPLNITGGTWTSVAVSSGASHGTATSLGDEIQYSPASGYVGTDSFQYTASNGAGTSAPATVSITVSTTTPPPIANPSNATVGYNSVDRPLPLNITGGAPTSVAVTSGPSHGGYTISATTISYTPTTGYSGPDSLTYTATNMGGTSSPALVSITVSSPNTHVSPNPVWGDINGGGPNPATVTNLPQTIQGINTSITLELDTGVSTGRIFKYSKNGGTWTVFSNGSTVSVAPNDNLAFSVTKIQPGTTTGSITVLNQSDANTVLDTFFFNVTASGS